MMRRLRLAILVAAGLALLAFARPSSAQDRAEAVEADMSSREISIKSDFTGAEIVVFGSVDGSKRTDSDPDYYDVIIVIRGPAETVIARKKERFAGIWVNGPSEGVTELPSFYAVLSTRPLTEIADMETLRKYGVEFDPNPASWGGAKMAEEFADAIVRIKKRDGLYIEKPDAVKFLGRSLFRGNITLPVKVIEGDYTATIYLLQAGKLLSRDDVTLTVKKVGLERILETLAFERPWLYGFMAVLMAVACGFTGWMLFGRS
ncbi:MULTISPECIES: TIGR02186 family protein [Rhodomicrobium]|uniref:TIGR02186 family protein n=1 Tax=Rhodomicrobium TaxID=1068 RepID=UPI000B4AFDBC|nr:MULTISPECIES: TIGR02186 family protein [Rhodomicrobium]